ncbi:MAG: Gfo/Idh/MocA family oxidoreductase [Clostridia bacterium]|nr:Gfo/Idh/MocA family oxidoreductase [Clostridia bacterium]
MIRIAMLSKWHVHAVDYAKQIRQSGKAEITCIWDDDAERGRAWAEELGVDFEGNLDQLLTRSDVDAVIVCTPTTDHEPVMIAAARAGKHIFTEKVMATTVEACRNISQAIQENKIKFCISYPQLTWPIAQYAKQLIDNGTLGRITYMRMRTAHGGSLLGWLPDYWYDLEKAGGGAMMDLGCHPMYTASYLLGKPCRIASVFNNSCAPAPVDDNSVSVVEFENKAIAVLETSFVSPWSAGCFELLGTEGALVSVDGVTKVRSTSFAVDGWVIPDKLPDNLPMPIQLWLDGISSGSPIPFDETRGEALTELMENAYRSDREQRIVTIDGPCI